MKIPQNPRILISRLSAIGDAILTLPVASAVRRRYPDAYLAWVVEEKSLAPVSGHRCLDDVIVLPRGWFTSWRGVIAARDRLRRGRFQISIDCQGMTKSALAGWLSGATQRVGYAGPHARELSGLLNNRRVRPVSPHVTDRSLELLGELGIEDPSVEWHYPVNEQPRAWAAELIDHFQLRGRYAVINPGASWPSKLWKMSRFGDVARYLGQQHELRSLIVWGSSSEHQLARQIVATSGGYAELAPATDLEQLAALIERGSLFLSADTGPLHMAVALGVPSIGLHGVTRPEESGPYGTAHEGILVEYHGGSSRQRRRANNSAMLRISSEIVCRACDRLLDPLGRQAA